MIGEFATEIKNRADITEKMNSLVNSQELTNAKEEYQEKSKTYKLVLTIDAVLLVIVGIIFLLMMFTDFLAEYMIIVIIFLFALVGVLVFCTYYLKKYKQNYLNMFVPSVVKAIYGDDATYDARGGFSRDYLRNLNLFPVNDLHVEDYICGEFDGVPCQVCDVISSHVTSNGKNTETVIDYQGYVFSIKMNKKAHYPLEVKEKNIMRISKNEIQFESEEFNRTYHTYCDDQETAFYIITPQMQERMLDVNNNIPGGLTYLFRGEELVLLISDNETEFNIDPDDDINCSINSAIDAVIPMAYIIDSLHLSHKYNQ